MDVFLPKNFCYCCNFLNFVQTFDVSRVPLIKIRVQEILHVEFIYILNNVPTFLQDPFNRFVLHQAQEMFHISLITGTNSRTSPCS